MIQVEIITIGDEILIGQIVDTNSAWIAQELNKDGFTVKQITSVSDSAAHIEQALGEALTRADIVLITGGIGPTKDDVTKQTLCRFFHTRLVFNEAMYENVKRVLSHFQGKLNELNRSQAYVPEYCTPIINKVGTAPIMWFDRESQVVVSMPGVPSEMMTAMSEEIIPRLKAQFKTPHICHQNVLVHGYPESLLAEKLTDWENALPAFIKLAYLPTFELVKLRLSASHEDKQLLETALNAELEELQTILGEAIIATEDLPFEEIIGQLLRERSLTVATAESCTGGNIAHLITSVSGSSDYFKGGIVAYDNEAKHNLLGVSPEALKQFGAVSQQVVEQMAVGARRALNTDLAVATSGVAGPAGGSVEKPVGTVWIAACDSRRVVSRRFQFGTIRERNVSRASVAALVMLKELTEGKL